VLETELGPTPHASISWDEPLTGEAGVGFGDGDALRAALDGLNERYQENERLTVGGEPGTLAVEAGPGGRRQADSDGASTTTLVGEVPTVSNPGATTTRGDGAVTTTVAGSGAPTPAVPAPTSSAAPPTTEPGGHQTTTVATAPTTSARRESPTTIAPATTAPTATTTPAIAELSPFTATRGTGREVALNWGTAAGGVRFVVVRTSALAAPAAPPGFPTGPGDVVFDGTSHSWTDVTVSATAGVVSYRVYALDEANHIVARSGIRSIGF
jgi:hypothetical protein